MLIGEGGEGGEGAGEEGSRAEVEQKVFAT